MSDNGRKRSRKSKLVPRDCSDFSEVDKILQEPASKKPLLTIIKKEDDAPPGDEAAPHEFSINVEVEDVVESISDEDPSDYMQYLFSLSKSKEEEEKGSSDKGLEDKAFTLDFLQVQKMLSSLHKLYPSDKELVTSTRNHFGKYFMETFDSSVSYSDYFTDLEKQLQEALKRWKQWQITSKIRTTPFCYKCYVCMNAWWSLHDFINHVKRHRDCKIQSEIYHNEFNIIAFESEEPIPDEIVIYGNCLKCTKTFSEHRESRKFADYNYNCSYCSDEFPTCVWLNRHLGVCPRNPSRLNNKCVQEEKCQICDTIFFSKSELYLHREISHSVRNDEPVALTYKICKLCERPYFFYTFHVCTKRLLMHSCKYCHGMFQNRSMLEVHLKMSENSMNCAICSKFIIRECMAAEHYVTHSRDFMVAYRCLNCRKIKILLSEDAARSHKSKYHRNVDYRRPGWAKIVMPRIMLEKCQHLPNAPRQTKCRILQGNKSGPKTYVNKAKARKAKNQAETPENNWTIVHDPPDNKNNEEITTKDKPTEDAASEDTNSQDTIADDANSQTTHEDTSSQRTITEDTNSQDTVTDFAVNDDSTQDSKDFPKLPSQITEDLDIEPDVIKVKEEKPSESDGELNLFEDSKSNEETVEVSKDYETMLVTEDMLLEAATAASNLENLDKDMNNVVSEILESATVVKQEIKEEAEEFDEDLIILNSSSESVKQESVSANSDSGVLNLEPEVILRAGYRKRKIYKCNRCDYEGFHREYKEHINGACVNMPSIMKNACIVDLTYKCTKCNKSFRFLKTYVTHFGHHKYKYMSCPQCREQFDTMTKLMPHFNNHIKSQFVRMKLIKSKEEEDDEDYDQKKNRIFQCKTCKEQVQMKDTFKHWELHLEIVGDKPRKHPSLQIAANRTDKALTPEQLIRILGILTPQDEGPVKIRTCFVCERNFERQNDCKRHLIEHLLEDAYANLVNTQSQLKCQICKELFAKAHCYKKHMRDHASLPIYQCSLCNKTFSDSSNFTKHKKIHNLRAYVCDICHKKFQAKFSLEKHMLMHMSCDPYTCSQCDRVFYDKSFLNRHIRQQHEKDVFRFRCMACGKKYATLREKWDHMWEVHKQRKEKADCPICYQSFRKFVDVKKHARNQHGIHISLASVFQMMQNQNNDLNLKQVKVIRVTSGSGNSIWPRMVKDTVFSEVSEQPVSEINIIKPKVVQSQISVESSQSQVPKKNYVMVKTSQGDVPSHSFTVTSQGAIPNYVVSKNNDAPSYVVTTQGDTSSQNDSQTDDSDDDVMLIEEERETLVILDDDVPNTTDETAEVDVGDDKS